MAQSILVVSKYQHANNAPEHTSISDQHLLFKQGGAGRENDKFIIT